MKRLILLLTALMMLTACSPNRTKTPFSPTLPQQLLETDAFSEPLEPLESDLVWMLYGLEDAGLDRERLISAGAARSTGATCEEVALLSFTDEAIVQDAVNILARYLSAQIEINKDYRPAELPKLKQAILEQRGTTVLLLVANDYQATHELLTP